MKQETYTTYKGKVLSSYVGQAEILLNIDRWHQDVKPSNILVCSGDSKSPYGYRFKLGDLGLSHFKMNVTPRKGPVTDADSYGTRAYGESFSPTKSGYNALDNYFRGPGVLQVGSTH